jgi:hypothetical protein
MSTREYSGVTAARVEEILAEAKQHGASISGDAFSGEVVGSGAHVVYAFHEAAAKLSLTVKQKPFFVSENFVFAAIEDNTGLAKTEQPAEEEK